MKFDLATLVKQNLVKEGETLFFVSDPNKNGKIEKIGSHEFKVRFGKDLFTIHTLAQTLLGQDPPVHASKWLRNSAGTTLYDIWQETLVRAAA
jgi:hypothetical protein